MKINNSKNKSFMRTLFAYIVLCSVSIIASQANTNNLTAPFESSSQISPSYIGSPDNNDLFASDANNYIPFSSPQNDLLFAGFGDDDDFGDEEIGIIPVGDGIGYLIFLALVYILVSQKRKHIFHFNYRICFTRV